MSKKLLHSNTDHIDEGEEIFDPPLAVSVEEAAKLANASRTAIYEALQRKDLKAKKAGRRTIILREALKDYLAGLPDYDPKASAGS